VRSGGLFPKRLWVYCYRYAIGDEPDAGIVLASEEASVFDLFGGHLDSLARREMRIELPAPSP